MTWFVAAEMLNSWEVVLLCVAAFWFAVGSAERD